MKEINGLFARAKELGITKWKIAKKIGVHWNSVRHWELGNFSPTKENLDKLKEIVK